MKIAYQGIPGSYSESCVKENYPECETIACKTFDECFQLAKNDSNIKAIIPEQNQIIGNININFLHNFNCYGVNFFWISTCTFDITIIYKNAKASAIWG